MRVLLNKLLALFLLCSSAVNSQHVYLAHRTWKDKYIKQQNLNKQTCHLVVHGKEALANVALPTFLLLLVTEDWNKQGLNGFWKTTKNTQFLCYKQLCGPRYVKNHIFTILFLAGRA